MQVKQVATFVNQALQEAVTNATPLAEDLSNVVDMGTAVFNANAVDNYVKSLVDHIGRVIFVDRAYRGRAPKVLMDAWEYGSVLEKISMETPEAVENPTWNLQDGQVYEQDKFSAPSITVKFFNSKTTFEVPISITDRQVRESFSGPEQLAGFISMIYTTIENSMTRAMDALIMRAITNFIAATYDGSEGRTVIDLKTGYLALHPDITSSTYTLNVALHDPEFLKYAGETIRLTTKLMGTMSRIYNQGGKDRFTPAEDLHLILLTDLVSATSAYLESSTFHKELVALPLFEEVPYWQANGELTSRSMINVEKLGNGSEVSVETYVLGVMFDRNALGVSNWNKRTTSHRNNHAEFENLWYKNDAGFFNDLNEQFVVFTF